MNRKPVDRSLELSLLKTCPVNCDYCPQETLKNAVRRTNSVEGCLDPLDARSCVRNASIDPGGIVPVDVYFAGFTEPLLSPHFVSIFRSCEVEAEVRSIVVYSTGRGIDPAKIDIMRRSKKLALVDWHLPATCGEDATSWHFMQHMPAIREIGVERQRASVIVDRKAKVDLEPLRSQLPFELRRVHKISRAGNVPHVASRIAAGAVTCCKVHETPRPIVLPGGDVSICCNDFGLELIIGNLKSQTWDELDFDRVRRLQQDPSSGALCFRGCHIAKLIENR